MSEVKLGRVAPIYKGVYDPLTSYSALDIVFDKVSGQSFIAKQPSKGNNLPTNDNIENDYWGLVAKKGEKGPIGLTGERGESGKNGLMGPVGDPGPKGEPGKDVTTFSVDKLHENIIKDAYYGAYGSPFKEYYINSIDRINNTINEDCLNIGFITDNHYQPGYSPNALTHYSHLETLSRISGLDTIVLGGDNINGDITKENLNKYTDTVSSFVFGLTDSDVFMLKGNHDKGIGQKGGLFPDKTLSDTDIKKYYKTGERLYSEIRDADSLYGFKDYPEKRIRVVFMDSFDVPETLVNGMYKYNTLVTSAYSPNQLNWLADTALNLPDDTWSVIIFTHAPIPGTFLSEDELQYNGSVFKDILTAFVNKNAINTSSKEDNEDFKFTLKKDLSGYKGSLVAVVTGHVHADGMMRKDGINFIETTASLCYSGDAPRRLVDTDTEDSWDVYSINSTTKNVTIYRFGGYGTDRQFRY